MTLDDRVCIRCQESLVDDEPSTSYRSEETDQEFQDSIHKSLTLSGSSCLFVDSAAYQRLRDLKQLGVSHWVFQGATHTRFEHSLGVGFLAYKAGHRIHKKQGRELDMRESDVLAIELAGLCHDLGHGPFSHMFEREFLPMKGITDWCHEEMSCKVFDLIRDRKSIDEDIISSDTAKLVQSLILNAHGASQLPAGRRYMGDLVANGRNGLDVDKFDYLQRDAMYCGVNLGCNLERIFKHSRVINDEVCYHISEYDNIFKVYEERANMFKAIYMHRASKGIELMLCDALAAADSYFRIAERAQSVEEFVTLDDTLVKQIEHYQGQDAGVLAAQKIIARIHNRKLYRFVREAPIPKLRLEANQWRLPTAADIVSHYSGPVALDHADVMVSEARFDFSMKDANPMDSVRFFEAYSDTESFVQPKKNVNATITDTFQDVKVRVFSRVGDTEYLEAVQEAFESWSKKTLGVGPEAMGTPIRSTGYEPRTRGPASVAPSHLKRSLFTG